MVFNRTGKPVVIEMSLHRIRGRRSKHFPEGYRIGWIAFDPESPLRRVLFDSHPPKGVHFHIDGDSIGAQYQWQSLEDAESTFFRMVSRHFAILESELL